MTFPHEQWLTSAGCLRVLLRCLDRPQCSAAFGATLHWQRLYRSLACQAVGTHAGSGFRLPAHDKQPVQKRIVACLAEESRSRSPRSRSSMNSNGLSWLSARTSRRFSTSSRPRSVQEILRKRENGLSTNQSASCIQCRTCGVNPSNDARARRRAARAACRPARRCGRRARLAAGRATGARCPASLRTLATEHDEPDGRSGWKADGARSAAWSAKLVVIELGPAGSWRRPGAVDLQCSPPPALGWRWAT